MRTFGKMALLVQFLLLTGAAVLMLYMFSAAGGYVVLLVTVIVYFWWWISFVLLFPKGRGFLRRLPQRWRRERELLRESRRQTGGDG